MREIQSNTDSSNSVGKLDVFENTLLESYITKDCLFKRLATAVDSLGSWSRRQIIDTL